MHVYTYNIWPTKYFCINSDPQTRRNVADVWLATALTRRVFPTHIHVHTILAYK